MVYEQNPRFPIRAYRAVVRRLVVENTNYSSSNVCGHLRLEPEAEYNQIWFWSRKHTMDLDVFFKTYKREYEEFLAQCQEGDRLIVSGYISKREYNFSDLPYLKTSFDVESLDFDTTDGTASPESAFIQVSNAEEYKAVVAEL